MAKFNENITINGREFGRLEQKVTAAQLAAITPTGTTVAVSLTGFPTNARPIAARIHINTPFAATGAGISITAMVATVGDAADPDELLDDTDIMPVSPAQDFETPVSPGTLGEEAAYAPRLTVTLTPADTETNADLTAGELIVVIWWEKLHL
jgi:hypothetical protein